MHIILARRESETGEQAVIDMAEIWERQPGETAKAYNAFCVYRDLGPGRSLEKAAQALGLKSRKYFSNWHARHNWVARAEAYDMYIEKLKRQEHEQAILEMTRRHAELAVAFQEKIAERIRTIDPNELTPQDLARWLEIATKLERLSRGEPTEIGRHTVDLPQIVEVVTDETDED